MIFAPLACFAKEATDQDSASDVDSALAQSTGVTASSAVSRLEESSMALGQCYSH
jgi:hypothetical protein